MAIHAINANIITLLCDIAALRPSIIRLILNPISPNRSTSLLKRFVYIICVVLRMHCDPMLNAEPSPVGSEAHCSRRCHCHFVAFVATTSMSLIIALVAVVFAALRCHRLRGLRRLRCRRLRRLRCHSCRGSEDSYRDPAVRMLRMLVPCSSEQRR